MPYKSDTVAAIVNRLNVQYFLPAIQREFVWSADQIVQLFDSLLRGYPISSFLFWELTPENRDRWEAFKFIADFSQKEPHNESANTSSVQQMTLVLDGQQRLTSLFIGLKGSYTGKKKYKRRSNDSAWERQRLYLDLLKDARSEDGEDGDLGIRYGLSFTDSAPKNTPGHRWFSVGYILTCDGEAKFDELVEAEEAALPEDATLGQQRMLRRNLERLYRAIWRDEAIAYHTEHEQNYDRVLDIFVRANEGGTKLSKSDLLLSMVTLKWSSVNAREEIYSLVDRLNNQLTRKNDFDKDFVMKACLYLSDLPVGYKVSNFSARNIETIESRWPAIKKAIEVGVDLVNRFGIDRDNITSQNALIPVIYYLYQNHNTAMQGNTPFDARNSTAIWRWVTVAMLNNAFGGSSDTALQATRRALVEDGGLAHDFPAASIDRQLYGPDAGRTADEETLDNVLGTAYGRPGVLLALSLLYGGAPWGAATPHVDHIFPKALLSRSSLAAAGLGDRYDAYGELCNRIGNLQLLDPQENRVKADQPFETWAPNTDGGYKQRHLIPEDPELLQLARFPDFVEQREALIRQHVAQLLGMNRQQSVPAE